MYAPRVVRAVLGQVRKEESHRTVNEQMGERRRKATIDMR